MTHTFSIDVLAEEARTGLAWLERNLTPLFAGSLREDADAIGALAASLSRLRRDRELVIADRTKELILARLDEPGSIFDTLQQIQDRGISYAEIFHSTAEVPHTGRALEVQRYVFDRKPPTLLRQAGAAPIPDRVRRAVRDTSAGAEVPEAELDEILRTLWLNDRRYVELAPPTQLARFVKLLHDGRAHGGFFLDAHAPEDAPSVPGEVNLLFAVESPPPKAHLFQIMQVLNALNLGVRRSVTLVIATAGQPFFLGSFHIAHRAGKSLATDSALFGELRRQLYNTQILATGSAAYREFVLPGIMKSDEAGLVNAMIGFCHTNQAHNQPHRFTFEDVVRAFVSAPAMALHLVKLFVTRFDPDLPDRDARYAAALPEAEHEIESFNTGHRQLDEFRRSVFRAALIFVRRTLKTNFFVPEKHALAFRLDPAYLEDLGAEFTSDLPPQRPFRVTLFHDRSGLGYHIGFSDIARGGWRTIVTRSRDDFVTVANTLFRENYVLAHTQHLKNKDIYEGGSKLVCVLHVPEGDATREQLDQRIHKLQYAFTQAFLDIFITENGVARDRRVVDHYRQDEPIELGPDENMHDEMIEAIAEISARRGYVLGTGIMSSKRVGINHKHYGVTSLGVVTFAERAMREVGIDMRRDPFTVNFTGGPNGDVAGNGMRLLLARCPRAQIRLVVDGTGALYDPRGLDHAALSSIVLRADADAFDPAALSPGGFVLYRNKRRNDGLLELYRRVDRTASGVEERWITLDEFFKEYNELIFTVPADLFIPAGGRPETVDGENWQRLMGDDGKPKIKVIVEGANSFITPAARDALQGAGVVLLRDAAANKCGVISSSYEIIGNLLLDEGEFLAHKEQYVQDVLEILEHRAASEAELILRRHRDEQGKRSFTQISDGISLEINAYKARLFALFETKPELRDRPAYRAALMAHLPRIIRETPGFRDRIARLPPKYRSAILAAEIATRIVYRGGFEPAFEETLERYMAASRD